MAFADGISLGGVGVGVGVTVLLLLSVASGHEPLISHGGPLLTGEIQLGLFWYGTFSPCQKEAIKNFICSLNAPPVKEPSVSKWWSIVESFQPAPAPPIRVSVANEACDDSYSIGKVVTSGFFPRFMGCVTGANKNMVVVIFIAKDVSVQGLCMGYCSRHGLAEDQVYIVIGDSQTECPEYCGWPYVKSEDHPGDVVLKPVHGEWPADALVVHLASALASTVTNPKKDGFFAGRANKPIEAGTICELDFGSGATEECPGKVETDPVTGGAFNAYGATENDKFLLPGLWCPATQACWSLL